MVMIVAATVVTTVNIHVTINVHVGITIDIHMGVSIDVFGSIDIFVVIDVGARMAMHLPGHCVPGQYPAGSDDKTPDRDEGDKPGE